MVKKITCCLPNALYYIMVLDTAKERGNYFELYYEIKETL